MSCTPFETLSAYVDRALPELESASVTGHLQSSEDCRSRLDELRWLKDAVTSSAPAATASDEFKARLATAAAVNRRRRRNTRLGTAFAGGLTVALATVL